MEDRTIVILYGSETGCAQDMAENLSRQARRRQFRTRVFAMDDYDKVNGILTVIIHVEPL
jgi:sulfite reductase alpha subunit-like flavoprotein